MTLRRRTELQRNVPLVNRTSMRRTPLARGKPLERTTAMPAAVVPLKRSPMKRSRVEAKLTKPQRDALAERSGGICEVQSEDCTYRALDPAHRNSEGMGGRSGAAAEMNDRLSNILHSCRRCHDWCHRWPTRAEAEGWALREGDDPLTESVHYRRLRWVLFDNEGGMETTAAPADYREAS